MLPRHGKVFNAMVFNAMVLNALAAKLTLTVRALVDLRRRDYRGSRPCALVVSDEEQGLAGAQGLDAGRSDRIDEIRGRRTQISEEPLARADGSRRGEGQAEVPDCRIDPPHRTPHSPLATPSGPV